MILNIIALVLYFIAMIYFLGELLSEVGTDTYTNKLQRVRLIWFMVNGVFFVIQLLLILAGVMNK